MGLDTVSTLSSGPIPGIIAGSSVTAITSVRNSKYSHMALNVKIINLILSVMKKYINHSAEPLSNMNLSFKEE
jgi:hypothetical protein